MEILLDQPNWNQELAKALAFLESTTNFHDVGSGDLLESCDDMRKHPSYRPIVRMIESYWDAKAHGFSEPGYGLSFSRAEAVFDDVSRVLGSTDPAVTLSEKLHARLVEG